MFCLSFHLVCQELLFIDSGGALSHSSGRSLTPGNDLLFLLLIATLVEAVLAEPPDQEDDGTNDQAVLDNLNNDDPDDNAAHVAHIAIRALSSLLAEALLAAAVTALIIRGAFSIDGCALEAGLLRLVALQRIGTTVTAAAIRCVLDLVARLSLRNAACTGT